jgi:hypothetical protein
MLRRSQMLLDGRAAFFLALGYLIWSLLPHAHFQVHAHADGELPHSHFSFHDLKLRNQTLVTANPEDASDAALGRATVSVSAESESADGGAHAGAAVERAFATEKGFKPLNLRHGHFTEDQNILAIGMAMAAGEPAAPLRISLICSTLSPLLPYSGPTQARGPPSPA